MSNVQELENGKDILEQIDAALDTLLQARIQIEWLRMQQAVCDQHIGRLSAEVTRLHRQECTL